MRRVLIVPLVVGAMEIATVARADEPPLTLADSEITLDFAAVGALGGVSILEQTTQREANTGVAIIAVSTLGGGGIGYLLSQKFVITAGGAATTTLGTTVGLANGLYLLQPTRSTRNDASVASLLFGSTAIGATTGFIYGQVAKPTLGQALFVDDLALIGTASAFLSAAARSSHGGSLDNTDITMFAIGTDGGMIAGAAIAPLVRWSARRSKIIFYSTSAGLFGGGLVASALAHGTSSSQRNLDVITGSMTAGMWAGFGIGVYATQDDPGDATPVTPMRSPPPVAMVAPWMTADGASGTTLGVKAGGSF